MEKYGVQLDDPMTKTGSVFKNCPGCGQELNLAPNDPPHCPKCGTEPFEKKPAKK